MDDKYIWPIVGVVLGWFLNAVSANAKNRMEKKKSAAKLLSKLIQIESQVSIYQSTIMNMRAVFDDESEFEKFRIGLISRHFLKPDTLEQDLKNAIDEYSSIHPLTATQLESTYQSLLKIKTINLTACSSKSQTYEKMYRTVELNAKSCQCALEHHIKSVALRHSFITYFRVRFTKYKQVKTSANDENIRELVNAVTGLEEVKQSCRKNS